MIHIYLSKCALQLLRMIICIREERIYSFEETNIKDPEINHLKHVFRGIKYV